MGWLRVEAAASNRHQLGCRGLQVAIAGPTCYVVGPRPQSQLLPAFAYTTLLQLVRQTPELPATNASNGQPAVCQALPQELSHTTVFDLAIYTHSASKHTSRTPASSCNQTYRSEPSEEAARCHLSGRTCSENHLLRRSVSGLPCWPFSKTEGGQGEGLESRGVLTSLGSSGRFISGQADKFRTNKKIPTVPDQPF